MRGIQFAVTFSKQLTVLCTLHPSHVRTNSVTCHSLKSNIIRIRQIWQSISWFKTLTLTEASYAACMRPSHIIMAMCHVVSTFTIVRLNKSHSSRLCQRDSLTRPQANSTVRSNKFLNTGMSPSSQGLILHTSASQAYSLFCQLFAAQCSLPIPVALSASNA